MTGSDSKIKFKKKFTGIKRHCFFTRFEITYIDYKDTKMLKRFISRPGGRILPRFLTGTKCKYQKHLAKAIKRARFLGLISYIQHPEDDN